MLKMKIAFSVSFRVPAEFLVSIEKEHFRMCFGVITQSHKSQKLSDEGLGLLKPNVDITKKSKKPDNDLRHLVLERLTKRVCMHELSYAAAMEPSDVSY